MRKLPRDESRAELVPPAVEPRLDRRLAGTKEVSLITQVRHYELITPLFGGGVDPGEADPLTIIRGPAIRGQLRFWWRACRGGQFNGDLRMMKEAEDELWGAASTEKEPRPSLVQIRLEIANGGQHVQPFESRTRPSPNWRDLAYATFPLQDKNPPGEVRTGVKFKLTLTYPQKRRAEVEAALWAWETFGGVGARTRRGFGALKLLRIDDKPVPLPGAADVVTQIREGLQRHVTAGEWPAQVPHLAPALTMKVTQGHPNPKAAWTYLIKQLKAFRQARNSGVSPRQPGRSRWPEPDAIRKLTGNRAPKHRQALLNIDKFPRAAFGLPIVFHFKDAGDPQDTILQGKACDRLASPLILRPLACADSAVGLAVILEGTGLMALPGGLALKEAKGVTGKSWPVEAGLSKVEAKKIEPLNGNPALLEAFLEFLNSS
jgi:CRISPR-associated protein Cmr1